MLEILLGWVFYLAPDLGRAEPPELEYQEHSFFVENACGGKECNVLGWYNDNGTLYLDDRVTGTLRDQLIVHELVHYLQDVNGDYDSLNCEDSLARERQAYRIQQAYAIEGQVQLPRMVNHKVRCNK